MIIGICGFIGSGKDTVADYLVNIHEFRRESFASALKDSVSAVFGWDRTMLEGRTKQSREWRDQIDLWWADRLNIPQLTPRWVLQQWGTDVCRQSFHDDIWIASLENKLRNSQDDVVISDCRFPNEITAIRRAGGCVIRVVRGIEPAWYQDAINVNQGLTNMGFSRSKTKLEKLGIHASETSWVGTEFDYTLNNNETLDELYHQVNDLLRDLRVSTVDLP